MLREMGHNFAELHTDVTSGFFGIRRAKLSEMGLGSSGFDLNVEIYGKALKSGWLIVERPVRQLAPWPGRRPHLRTIRDGFKVLARLLWLG
jgi:hypothetical protein